MFDLSACRVDLFFRFFAAEFLARRSRRLSKRIENRTLFFGLFLLTRHRTDYTKSIRLRHQRIDNSGALTTILTLGRFCFPFIHLITKDRSSFLPERSSQITRLNRTRNDVRDRRGPFWVPTVNYYLLAFGIAVCLFFLVWGVGQEGRGENSQTIAFVIAMTVLGGAVVLREFILRNARRNFYRDQKRLDRSLAGFSRSNGQYRESQKVTLDQNELIVREIRKKSEAARVLSKLSAGHQEVVAMCSEYLAMNQREMQNVGIGSPRIVSFARGRKIASKLHHYHLMKWAELETQEFTQIAVERGKIEDKLDQAQKALAVVAIALESYPTDPNLLESRRALLAAEDSLNVSQHLEHAEEFSDAGDHRAAAKHYEQALALMEEISGVDGAASETAGKIIKELEKARSLAETKKIE